MPRLLLRFLIRARNAASLDTRALSLFRIGIAMLLLCDLVIRAGDLHAFYSDEGVAPRALVQDAAWNPVYVPLYMFSGSAVFSGSLFALAGIFALLLLIGWRTRLFTVLSWLMLIALHNRNPYVLQGGDELLRNALFWAMFLPLGKHYSIDALRAGKNRAALYKGIAAAGYVLLICSVYFFSALQKNSAEWQTEGSALYYALSLDQLALPAGKLIYPYPVLLKILTHLAYVIELLGWILLLTRRGRLAGIFLLAGLHLGIGLTLYVGLFFLIGLVTLLPLLPSRVMDKLDRRLRRFGKRKEPEQVYSSRRVFHPLLRKTGKGFLLSMLVYCLAWNCTNIPWFPYKLDPPARLPAALLRTDQNWGMFAPKVFKDDGWYIHEGRLNDSSWIDLNSGQKIVTKKPENIVAHFPNDRWRKYSENLLFTFNDYLRPYYCRYLMQKWNAAHPERPVNKLRLVYMKEVSLPGYRTQPLERSVLSEYR